MKGANRKQKARSTEWNGLESRKKYGGRLALGFFGDFFFLRALFFVFLLQLVADEFEDGDLSAIADADAGGDDARVAARAIRKLRSDVGEKLLRHVRAS